MQNQYNIATKIFAIFLIFFLSACQGRYASLNNTMSQCGFKEAAYADFHACMDEKLPQPHPGEQDYYAKTATDIRSELQAYAEQIQAKKLKEKQAYEYFAEYVNQKNIEEQQSAQVAGAIVAVALIGVAANTCYNTGGCGGSGGSGSNESHQGCCSWHNGINHCDGTHLICNDGWVSGCSC
jgi:hypothetical protein